MMSIASYNGYYLPAKAHIPIWVDNTGQNEKIPCEEYNPRQG